MVLCPSHSLSACFNQLRSIMHMHSAEEFLPAAGTHMGKVLIQVGASEEARACRPFPPARLAGAAAQQRPGGSDA